MNSNLLYQTLVAAFSGAVGFVAGLGVSWKTRRDAAGDPVYTPTLNTSRGWRALSVAIAILAVGTIILTAVTNAQNRATVENQIACNDVNRDDVVNNVAMIRGVSLLLATPREERDNTAFPRLLQTFLDTADENQARREAIPNCEARE